MFGELDESELEAIRARGELMDYRPGQRIFSAGEEGDAIYFIASGQVSVFIEKFSTREEVQSLGRGEWLGEMALYHNDRRTASAEALGAARMVRLRKGTFLQLLSADSTLPGRSTPPCAGAGRSW